MVDAETKYWKVRYMLDTDSNLSCAKIYVQVNYIKKFNDLSTCSVSVITCKSYAMMNIHV